MASLLIDKLENLTDKQRSEGKRHKISTVVIISIMAIISQIYSLRGIETYVKRHRNKLVEILNNFKIFLYIKEVTVKIILIIL